MKSNSIKNQAGFSLAEVLVCIVIIGTGIVAITNLMSQNIKIKEMNKNNLIASMLAQEGLELVRNQRDLNWLQREKEVQALINASDPAPETNATTTWDSSINGSYKIAYKTSSDNNILIDNTCNDINNPCSKLYKSTSGFYSHDTTLTPTNFSRIISSSLKGSASDQYLEVTATVKWKRASMSGGYEAKTHLYNWWD